MTKLITLAIVLAMAIGMDVARGDELNWQIMGPANSKVSNSGATNLNWQIMGTPSCKCDAGGVCTCGEKCVCKKVEAKPVVNCYYFPQLKCPGCESLKAIPRDDLPVRFVWKPAPAWVRSAPTAHWQTKDGRWVKWEFGEGRWVDRFTSAWERTQGIEAQRKVAGPS